jgi:methionyl-tRNA synthetase
MNNINDNITSNDIGTVTVPSSHFQSPQSIREFLQHHCIVTTALPYANGPLHLGHFYEATLADIYARSQTSNSNRNNDNYNYNHHSDSVCPLPLPCVPLIAGEDQHGAAITLFAKKQGIAETQHIATQFEQHSGQYQKLNINHAFFGQTHSPLHTQLTQYFFQKLKASGKIIRKTTQSWYDEAEKQYLPDRFVKGQCPHCHATNQYPEICEVCGKHFSSATLVSPVSTQSGNTPYLKDSEHYFLDTSSFYDNLKVILKNHPVIICEAAKAKLLDGSLATQDWLDISRDKPYFGIDVPSEESNQCFYVWFDAPIGYLSFTLEYIAQNYHQQTGQTLSFNQLLEFLPYIRFEHFIGKDIVYFHTYYWLNLLALLGLESVVSIKTHGWITDKGEKLSKSSGNSHDLNTLSDNQIDALRLYFFSHYENSIYDIELGDIYEQYNQVIIGKYINLYSRTTKLIETGLAGKLTPVKSIELGQWQIKNQQIVDLIQKGDFKLAYENWIILLNEINAWFQEKKPWQYLKENLAIDNPRENLNAVCFVAYQIVCDFHQWLGAVCPHLYALIEARLTEPEIRHDVVAQRLLTS